MLIKQHNSFPNITNNSYNKVLKKLCILRYAKCFQHKLWKNCTGTFNMSDMPFTAASKWVPKLLFLECVTSRCQSLYVRDTEAVGSRHLSNRMLSLVLLVYEERDLSMWSLLWVRVIKVPLLLLFNQQNAISTFTGSDQRGREFVFTCKR